MARDPLLVLDVHYLCHRAFHTTKDLSYGSKATGVIFGFLKTITQLKQEFMTERVAFCFEHWMLYRRDIYPPYKKKRATKERTEEEQKEYEDLKLQIKALRREHLPLIGFKNIFSFEGMESDDIMAVIARDTPSNEDVILITADSDLYQCLKGNVSIYSPAKKTFITENWFRKEYGIDPRKWAVVKAIAGCQSDEVEGIVGVGEITALKFVRGEASQKSEDTILSAENKAIVRRNRALVELPYAGCEMPTLVEDHISIAGWKETCKRLGMKLLEMKPPILRL